jgi:hypothetical protein
MSRAPVTVVTATIPGREELLGECLKSVYAQTVEVEEHLVMAQSCTEGLVPPQHVAIQQNVLLDKVKSTFCMRLADDDRLLPHHVGTLLPYLSEHDVIYSYDANGTLPRIDCTDWPQDQIVEHLSRYNWIDGSAVAIRTDMLREVGGWPTDWVGGNHMRGDGYFQTTGKPAEDWAAFYLLAQAGARFCCVPEDTWIYGTGLDAEGRTWVRSSNG